MTTQPEPDFLVRQLIATLPIDDPVLEMSIRAARASYLKADAVRDLEWLGPFIDDVPNPFDDDPLAGAALLEGTPAPVFLATAPYQPHHEGDDAIVADQASFDAMVTAARSVITNVLALGEEDGRRPVERGELLAEAVRSGRAWVLGDPIDGTLAYRRLRTDDYWAAVAVAGQGSSFAVCIVTGDLVVAALNERFVALWENGGWRLLAPPPDGVGRDGFSAIVPTMKRKYRLRFRDALDDSRIELICGFSGNPAILRGVVLGLVDAAIQPRCFSWDNAIAYVAACAGLPVMRLDTDDLLDAAGVRNLMIETLVAGEKLPDILVGRNDEAIVRLLTIVAPRDIPSSGQAGDH